MIIIENEATDLTKPVTENYSFISNTEIENVANKIFIKPLLFLENNLNPFTQDKRELPIYYGFPSQKRFICVFEIPQGYEIESVPNSIIIKTSNDVMTYNYRAIISENIIQFSIVTEINSALIHQDFYPEIKDFYKKIISKQNEQLVLIKK